MSNLATSFIRTYVPIIVGTVIAFLTANGITVDEDTQVQLIAGLSGLFTAIYYGIVHLLEQRWPQIGVLLGKASLPVYHD